MQNKPHWLDNLRASVKRSPFRFDSDMAAINYRPAAVLVLFWDDDGDPATVVTVRASTMPTHAGEVSFPGGGLKPGEDHAAAALREAQEEVGLDPSSVEILGQLDDAWSGAGFSLVPVVGYTSAPPALGTSAEVAKVVPMNLVTGIEQLERTVKKFDTEFTETFIRIGDTDVVGLTADLLLEAIEAVEGNYTRRGQRRYDHFLQYATPRP